MADATPRRVLIADDEADIVEIYRQILTPSLPDTGPLADLEAELFGPGPGSPKSATETAHGGAFDLEIVQQGEQAVEAVRAAAAKGAPFSVAFLDIRMPPGISGVEAARRIREIDAHINIVFVTGYSDVSLKDIANSVPPPDRMFYLQKPFQPPEIQQMAVALCARAP